MLRIYIIFVLVSTFKLAKGQSDTLFFAELLPDTIYGDCQGQAIVFADQNYSIYNWSNGQFTPSIIIYETGRIWLDAITNDGNVVTDTTFVKLCEPFYITDKYLCEYDLPITWQEMGIPGGVEILINGQPSAGIKKNVYAENRWVNFVYEKDCPGLGMPCIFRDSFMIITSDTLALTIDNTEFVQRTYCANLVGQIAISANEVPGNFECLACGGTETPFMYKITPSEMQAGIYGIQFSKDIEGCMVMASAEIRIVPPARVDVNGFDSTYLCNNGEVVHLNFLPGAGQYFANSVSLPSGVFDPNDFFPFLDSIHFKFVAEDSNGCSVDTSFSVDFRQPPLIDFIPLDPAYCSNDLEVHFIGLPRGGEYFLNNNIKLDGVLNFAQATEGVNFVTYIAHDNFCFDSITKPFTLIAAPDVKIVDFDTTICTNDASITLSSNYQNAIFKPDLFDGGVISPNDSLLGSYILACEVEENGCVGRDVKNIIFYPHPELLLNPPVYSCEPHTLTFLNFSSSPFEFCNNWTFTNDNFINNKTNFDYPFNNAGDHNIHLNIEDINGCKVDTSFSVIVPEVNFTFIEIQDSVVLTYDSIEFISGSNNQLINSFWQFGDGAVSGDSAIIHSYSEEGIYMVWLTTIDEYGCYGTSTQRVLVKDPLDLHFQIVNSYPNPTNSSVFIEFYLPEDDTISIFLVSELGHVLKPFTSVDGVSFHAGFNKYELDIHDFPTATYFIMLVSKNELLNGPYYFKTGELKFEKLEHLKFLKVIKI